MPCSQSVPHWNGRTTRLVSRVASFRSQRSIQCAYNPGIFLRKTQCSKQKNPAAGGW